MPKRYMIRETNKNISTGDISNLDETSLAYYEQLWRRKKKDKRINLEKT